MIAEMIKVQIAIPSQSRDELLQFLQGEEIIHVIEQSDDSYSKEGDAKTESTSYRIAQLQLALEFIGRVRSELHLKEKRDLRNMFSGKPIADVTDLEEAADRVQIDVLVSDVRKMSDT